MGVFLRGHMLSVLLCLCLLFFCLTFAVCFSVPTFNVFLCLHFVFLCWRLLSVFLCWCLMCFCADVCFHVLTFGVLCWCLLSVFLCWCFSHEGRSWYTVHRGRLWIAATAKAATTEEIAELENHYRSFYKGQNLIYSEQLTKRMCLLERGRVYVSLSEHVGM